MSNQPPLNPDALEAAARAANEEGWTCFEGSGEPGNFDSCEDCQRLDKEHAHAIVSAYLTVAQPEVNSANFPNVTRVEVIRDGGRALTVYGTEDVFYDIQDEGRTLKVFVKVPSPDYSAYRKAPYPERNRPEVKP